MIRRSETDTVGVPAGVLEEGETIEDCIRREVKEETGLILETMEVIGISSESDRETVQYPNGEIVQYFSVEFYSNSWHGKLKDRRSH